MKKVAIAVGITLLGICCIVVAYYCQFQYNLYQNTKTQWQRDLDGLNFRLKEFEWKMDRLEARKVRNLVPFHLSCEISTTDQPPFKSLNPMPANTNSIFKAWDGKGSGIDPEFRLPAGATNRTEYKIQIPERFGKPVDWWLSHAKPYRDLAAFDELDVYRADGTNMLKLVAQLGTNASVKMRFEIVVMCLSSEH